MQELEDYPSIHTTIVHPYQIDNNMFAGMQVRYYTEFILYCLCSMLKAYRHTRTDQCI